MKEEQTKLDSLLEIREYNARVNSNVDEENICQIRMSMLTIKKKHLGVIMYIPVDKKAVEYLNLFLLTQAKQK